MINNKYKEEHMLLTKRKKKSRDENKQNKLRKRHYSNGHQVKGGKQLIEYKSTPESLNIHLHQKEKM